MRAPFFYLNLKKYMNLKKSEILDQVNKMSAKTLMETLKIEFIEIGDNYVVCRMPVTSKVHQPAGILHGGATAALVETAGSFASRYFIKDSEMSVRGVEITTNHVKSISEGFVYAKALNIHMGRTMQIWEVRVTDESNNLISLGKLTTLSFKKNK